MKNQRQTIVWIVLGIFLLIGCVPPNNPTVVTTAQMYDLETPEPGVVAQITETPDSTALGNELDAMLQKAPN